MYSCSRVFIVLEYGTISTILLRKKTGQFFSYMSEDVSLLPSWQRMLASWNIVELISFATVLRRISGKFDFPEHPLNLFWFREISIVKFMCEVVASFVCRQWNWRALRVAGTFWSISGIGNLVIQRDFVCLYYDLTEIWIFLRRSLLSLGGWVRVLLVVLFTAFRKINRLKVSQHVCIYTGR